MQTRLRGLLVVVLLILPLVLKPSAPAGAQPSAADNGTWTAVAPMPTARFGLAATTGPDGRIYAIGGNGGNGAPPGHRSPQDQHPRAAA